MLKYVRNYTYWFRQVWGHTNSRDKQDTSPQKAGIMQ